MFNAVIQLDLFFTNAIYAVIPHNLFFDTIFSFLSVIGVAAVFWFVIMIYLFYIEEKRDKRFIPYFILAVGFSFIVSNMFLKNLVHRPRPIPPDIVSLSSCPRDYSFPSSHAAVAFSAATILITFDKKRKWYYIGGALLISLSRIYLQCHFFFDVVAGGLIGYAVSRFILLYELYHLKPSRKHSHGA